MQTLPYNPQLLHLAANIPLLGRLEKPDATARAISRLCGSWLEVDIKLDNGRIQDFRQRLEACALGQASAAILGQNIPGASPQEIRQAYKVFKTMLKEKGPPPKGRFPGSGHACRGS